MEKTWRFWSEANPCPICTGHRRGGRSGDDGRQCVGGYNTDTPSRVYCSNLDSGFPSASGKTFIWEGPPYQWSGAEPEPEENAEPRPRWQAPGIPSTWAQRGVYRYRDETGALLYSVVRFEPRDPEERKQLIAEGKRAKAFRPVRMPTSLEHAGQGYLWSLGGVRRVLYRLPEWRAAVASGARLFLVEGEKDADRGAAYAAEHGIAAAFTCANGGVRGLETLLRDHDGAELFQGVQVLDVVLDHDQPGEAVREHVHTYLARAVGALRFWRAAVDAPGADLSDHLDAGLGLDALKPA